jgi:hypothetical protein
LCLAFAIVGFGCWLMLAGHSSGQAANTKSTSVVAAAPVVYVRVLPLATKDIIYDSSSHFIYASVPSSAGRSGNSITSIEPVAGTIGPSTYIGSEPGKLAISDNNQYLYAALDGSASVRRFDLATRTPGLEFPLGISGGIGGTGPFFVEDMAVMPGSPATVAVSRKNTGFSPKHEGVAIYDDGVQRTVTTANHTGSNVIEFSSNSGMLYGYNNESSEYGFRRMSVNPSGATILTTSTSLISGFNVDMKYDNGFIYSTTGKMIDPETQTLMGTFTGPTFGSLVAPDSATNRVYYLTGSGSTLTLRAFDPNTFLETGSVNINNVSGTPTSLIRWGTNGLAFRTDSNLLYLIQTDIVPNGDSFPAPTPTPTFTPTPTPTPTPVADDVRQITLATKDLIYNARTQTIYASVPSSAGAIGNSITPINPQTAALGASVFIGSEPGKLAMSDNGQYLYAALDGSARVRRFILATQTPDIQFTLGNSQISGLNYVEDLEVMPGSPGVVAVSRRNQGFSPKHEGVAIYDEGVQRAATTPTHTGSNVIEFSPVTGALYGYNNETSESGFRKMNVDATGVSVTSNTQQLVVGKDIEFDNGLIYSNSGRVIDPETQKLVGTFSGFPFGSTILVAPDSATNRVYFLYGGFGASTLTLRAYDMTTFLPIDAVSITGVSGTPTSLIRWGAIGLAFRTDGGKVYLIRTHLVPAANAPSDFDKDGKADVALWRPSDHNWYIHQSASNSPRVQYDWGSGSLGDVAVPGDYDGDRKTDFAVWRRPEGNWYIIESSTGAVRVQNWGDNTDVPVPGDYDGDRKVDLAVFRPSTGNWYVLQSLTGTVKLYGWGANGDVPVPGDYDRDGLTDAAVFRSSEGNWYILQSATGTARLVNWGVGSDKPVAADYDGDGRTDVAVFRAAEGNWYIRNSSNNTVRVKNWGMSGDTPVPGDYDGDGRMDIAVWRGGDSNWYILQSATNTMRIQGLGLSGDICVPSAYLPQ